MTFDPSKYLNRATDSILEKVTGFNGRDLTSIAKGLDQTLSRVGAVFRKSDALSGADSILAGANDFSDSGSGESNPNRVREQINSSVQNTVDKKTDNNNTSLKYPTDLGDIKISMQFMKYERPAPMVKATPKTTVFIHLPIPKELMEVHTTQIRPVEMGILGSIMDAAQAQVAGDQGGSLQGTAVGKAPAMAARAAKSLGILRSASISDELAAGASQLTGAALNPNLSVAFHGPNLREYTLSWQFAPRSPDESASIKQIINEIKKRSLPTMTYEGSAGLLSYPEMVQLDMSPSTMPFKKALIRSINADYAAAGIPSFFKGTKEPTFIGLSVTFCEIEYFLSEDFGGEGGGGISDQALEVIKGIPSAAVDIGRETIDGLSSMLGGGGGVDPAITDTSEDTQKP